MDPRLTSYLSFPQYQTGLEQANKRLVKRQFFLSWSCSSLFLLALILEWTLPALVKGPLQERGSTARLFLSLLSLCTLIFIFCAQAHARNQVKREIEQDLQQLWLDAVGPGRPADGLLRKIQSVEYWPTARYGFPSGLTATLPAADFGLGGIMGGPGGVGQNLPPGAVVMTQDQYNQMMAGGGGGANVIYVDANGNRVGAPPPPAVQRNGNVMAVGQPVMVGAGTAGGPRGEQGDVAVGAQPASAGVLVPAAPGGAIVPAGGGEQSMFARNEDDYRRREGDYQVVD